MVWTVPFRFYGILRFLRKYNCWLSNYWFRKEWVIFDTTYLQLEASYRIAKTCRYNIYKNQEKLLRTMIVPSTISWWGGVWRRSIACRLYLWFSKSYMYKHGTRIVIQTDSRPKTYHDWTALDIGRSCYKRSSTLTVRKLHKRCVLRFRSKNFILFFEERSHRRTTVERKRNVNFLLVATVASASDSKCNLSTIIPNIISNVINYMLDHAFPFPSSLWPTIPRMDTWM